MIDISDGFTSISAGSDSIENLVLDACRVRSPTGARVTLEFRRDRALAPAQLVRVRYDFAGDGSMREATGIAEPIETVVRWGRAVAYRYRLSYWIAPAALQEFVPDNVRYRTEDREIASQPARQQALVLG
jgi:hypothetical protein